jgi:hypothetical protein
MISSRIDLTEHRDFSGGNDIIIMMDTPIEIPMDEYRLMTNEEYEKLIRWEGIFGRRRHYTETSEAFGKVPNDPFRSSDHCYKCGKIFRLPWDNVYGRCRKCAEEPNESGYHSRLPWVEYNGRLNDDVGYNLFNRR